MIRKMILLVTVVLLGVAFAQADVVWDFSYNGGGYSASGAFTTGNAGSPYTVTGITGTADGYSITGLSLYAGSNQLLYVPPVNGAYADFSGISFANASGVDYNITSNPGPSGNFINISTLDPGGSGTAPVAIDMSVTRVPEPAMALLLPFGLLFVSSLRKRFLA